jgi:hypothetical protein
MLITSRSDAPRQTTITNYEDGHSAGDVAMYLSADLAERMNEMINISKQCTAGAAFSSAKRFRGRDLED